MCLIVGNPVGWLSVLGLMSIGLVQCFRFRAGLKVERLKVTGISGSVFDIRCYIVLHYYILLYYILYYTLLLF